MKSMRELVTAVRDRHGSDRKAAVAMGVTQATFSRWRNGDDFPTDEYAIKIAELLQLDARYVSAVIRADRAKTEPARTMWRSVADAFGKAAMLAIFSTAPFLAPTPAQGAFNNNLISSGPEYTLGGKRRRRVLGVTL